MRVNYSGEYKDLNYDEFQMLTGYGTSESFLRIRYPFLAAGTIILILSGIDALISSVQIILQPGFFAFLGFSLLLIAGIFASLNWVQRRKKLGVKGEISGQITEEGHITKFGGSSLNLNWGAYRGYRQTENMILLLTRTGAQLLAKDFFYSERDWKRSLLMIETNLPLLDDKKSLWGWWIFSFILMVGIAVWVIYSFIRDHLLSG